MSDIDKKETFELDDSKNILSLDRYLHESIELWLHALTTAIKEGHQNSLEIGLVAQSIAANRVEGCAAAKKLIHWEKEDLPEKHDKHYDAIVRHNLESENYQKKLKNFKEGIEKLQIVDTKIKEARIGDFKVFEILKAIEKSSTKQGKVII